MCFQGGWNQIYHLDMIVQFLQIFPQVTRAAIQTFVIMFSLLGKDIETSKSLEATLQLLLTKTADTNRYYTILN